MSVKAGPLSFILLPAIIIVAFVLFANPALSQMAESEQPQLFDDPLAVPLNDQGVDLDIAGASGGGTTGGPVTGNLGGGVGTPEGEIESPDSTGLSASPPGGTGPEIGGPPPGGIATGDDGGGGRVQPGVDLEPRFGCFYAGERYWSRYIDDQWVQNETPSTSYMSETGQLYQSSAECELFELARWAIHPVGVLVWVPTLSILIFFVFGIFRILFPGAASGSYSADARKKETRAVINAYRSLRSHETETGSSIASILNSEWIVSIENMIDRLEREEQRQVKRVSLLQGLSMIVFALAIVIGLRALDTSLITSNPETLGFLAGFFFSAPFGVLVIASGFLVSQATKAYSERADLREEQNVTELLLLRSLSRLAVSIDFESVFENLKKAKAGAPSEEESSGKDTELSGKAKDLAVIWSYLNK